MIREFKQARELWKAGVPVKTIGERLKMRRNDVFKAIRELSREKVKENANSVTRKSVMLPELTEQIGNVHSHYSTWEARHKPPIGTCVAWVVEDGKAKQCGKPAKRQLCPDCAHKTLPAANSLGRRAV